MDTISKETRMNENMKFINELMDTGIMEHFLQNGQPGAVAGKKVRVKDKDGNYRTLVMELSYNKVKDYVDKQAREERERLCRGGECHDDEVGYVPELNEEDDGLSIDSEDKEIIGLA